MNARDVPHLGFNTHAGLPEGMPTDMNVYDAAALSAVLHLSERSNVRRSSAVDLPDFTRGRWQSTQPLGIVRA